MTESAAEPELTGAIAAVAAKAALLWIRPEGADRSWPAWQVWHEQASWVVSGPGEQPLPPLRGRVRLVFRSKAAGARLLAVSAIAEPLDPSDPRWSAAAQALAAGRLNSAVKPAELPNFWQAAGVQITRLAPVAVVHHPGSFPAEPDRAEPILTPATSADRRPWHLGGRRRRAARRQRFSLNE